MVTREWIDWYREEHKSRAKEVHLEGGLVKPRHPHWNLPYCSICDRDFEVEEEFYLLYVGGHAVGYHVDCVYLNIDTAKVRNIISQDKGYRMKRGFEGGQLPLIKRLPQKRGFYNIFRTEYSVINVSKLNIFESGTEVTPERLAATGLVKSLRYPVKILAEGTIKHPLKVRAHKFSTAAKAKIEAAGGSVEEIANESEAN